MRHVEGLCLCHPLSSVQSLSRVRLFATPYTTACQVSLSITNSRSPPKHMFIVSMMPSNHLILCHPRFLLPSVFPSIKVFYNESALPIRWPKYWNFSFSISPSKEYSGLISFSIDWFNLLAVQRDSRVFSSTTVWKHQIFSSVFFMVQLSHPYMTTGKSIALTIWTFVSKVMSLLFNTMSRFFIAFLRREKVSKFCGCNHHLHWFKCPGKWHLILFPIFSHLFAMNW